MRLCECPPQPHAPPQPQPVFSVLRAVVSVLCPVVPVLLAGECSGTFAWPEALPSEGSFKTAKSLCSCISSSSPDTDEKSFAEVTRTTIPRKVHRAPTEGSRPRESSRITVSPAGPISAAESRLQ